MPPKADDHPSWLETRKPAINTDITPHRRRPVPLLFHEAPARRAQRRPAVAVLQQIQRPRRQRSRVAGPEQCPGLA
ncbi:hypothetical protein RZS08_14395, partial [Arthrospira platensis SPKY1]|nr:hypothetical protein [Arthrospira platensis SPKY1]